MEPPKIPTWKALYTGPVYINQEYMDGNSGHVTVRSLLAITRP